MATPTHSGGAGHDIAAEALAAHNAGLRVLPPSEDGAKKPLGEWKAAQTMRATTEDLQSWYGPRCGLGIVCGTISGNLEALDFDCPETYRAFVDLARETHLRALVERVESGYLEETPAGGRHWLFRSDVVHGNTKLARRLKLPHEMARPEDKVKVLIETRGEGGYLIVAPSNGPVHPSGNPYNLVRGGFDTIPVIAQEERESLIELARTFDQMPKDTVSDHRYESPAGGDRPGDDYNRRADWRGLLESHGWQRVFERGGVQHYRRPGKLDSLVKSLCRSS